MNYSRICSCCGQGIEGKQITFLKETNQYDSEGNHCSRCYNEIAMNNQFQLMEVIDDVYNALKDPIKKFKFKHKTFEEKTNIIFRLIDKGVINFKIG